MATSQEDRGRLQHTAVPIRQLGCAEAAPGIERELRAVPGVTQVYVNPVTEMAYVEYDVGPVRRDHAARLADSRGIR